MDTLDVQRNLKQFLFWNRFWLALLGIALLVGTVYAIGEQAKEAMSEVHSYRRGDDICFSSSQGGVAITHIESKGLVAALGRPAFIVDSGKGCVNVAEFKNLDWRSDNGDQCPAPPPNAEYTGLYVRLERARERTKK